MLHWTPIPKERRVGTVLFAFLFFLLCPWTTQAQVWRWTFEDVDTPAEQTSIIADQEGNLHLAYYSPLGLRYGFRSALNSRWYKMTLDEHVGVFSTDIMLDGDGNPGICYTPRMMKYAHWDGKKWSIQNVDPGTGLIAYHCSLKYVRGKDPEITWYLESVFALRIAAMEDGTWKARTVEAGTQSGKYNSMVLDQKGLPHVAYNSFKNDELKYAYFDGKDWIRRALDTPEPGTGMSGVGVSLVLDSNDYPRISFYDMHSLKYARYDGNKWTKEVIEELPPFVDWGWKNFRSVQVLDHNGNPHICYESHLGLKHAWWDGKRWRTQLIKATSENWFFESAMTIDRDDNLYISFSDPSDGSLKVAIGKPTPAEQTAEVVKKDGSKN